MSKLIDILRKVGLQSPTPMGFSPASGRRELAAAMVVASTVALQGPVWKLAAADAEVDALVVMLESWDETALEHLAPKLSEHIWGVRLAVLTTDQARRLKDMGCDFAVFDAESTDAGVLAEDDLGKVLSVSGHLDEDVARVINALPIDAVYISPKKGTFPLKVGGLIDLQRTTRLVECPLVIDAPQKPGDGDLEALRNAGIVGLLMGISSPGKVAKMKEAIAGVPPRKHRPTRAASLVPASSGEEPEPDLLYRGGVRT